MRNCFCLFFKKLKILAVSSILLINQIANAQCVNANAQTNSATIFTSSVTSPSNSYDGVDGDVTTATTLSVSAIGIATLNVSFDQQANQGDSIIIMFGVPTANILDWGSFGSTTFTPFGNTAASTNASTAYTVGTLSFIITVGANSLSRIAIPVTNAAGAQSIKIQFTSLGAALGMTNYIYDVAVKPGPMNAANQTICYNTSTTLSASYTALSTQAIDVLWYDTDGTTLLQTTSNQNGAPYINSFVTPALTATKTYYVRERWNGCTVLSNPKAVTVTVRPQIAPAISIDCATLKLTTTTTNGTGPFSYIWTAASGGNISSGAATASPTITRAGTYSVQITDANTCVGNTSQIINVTNCAILPIRFLSFNVSAKDAGILLEWSTAEEINIIGFDIEFSVDGNIWNSIGFVSSNANSSMHSNSYSWKHQNVNTDNNFYRIKAVENNGNYSYSPTRSTKRISNTSNLSISPNPAKNNFTITGLYKNEKIMLFAINGVLLHTRIAANHQELIDMGKYSAGVYKVIISSIEGGIVYTSTIIKANH